MVVTCPKCAATIPAEDVNVARIVAKCRLCGAVFNFEDQLGLPKSPVNRAIARVMLPPGIELAVSNASAGTAGPYRGGGEQSGELLLVRKWFQPQAIMLLIFGAVWNSFLFFWYAGAASSGAPWIFYVFPLAHVAAGVAIIYGGLTGLLNRTTVRVANGRLTVRHGPIPAFGNRDIAVSDLLQLYTVTKTGSKGSKTHELHALPSFGPTIKLMSGLTDMQQAVYVERTVEDHLRIEDDPSANQQA